MYVVTIGSRMTNSRVFYFVALKAFQKFQNAFQNASYISFQKYVGFLLNVF